MLSMQDLKQACTEADLKLRMLSLRPASARQSSRLCMMCNDDVVKRSVE